MRLRRLAVQNFRGFERESFEFQESFTVLIGDNGAGKTAVLEALAIAAGAFFLGIERATAPSIKRSDIRFTQRRIGDEVYRDRHTPVRIEASGTVLDQDTRWARNLNTERGRTDRREARPVAMLAERASSDVRDYEQVARLPVIAYYGAGRLWLEKRGRATVKARMLPPDSPFRGYDDALDAATNKRRFVDWVKTRELQSLQRGESPVSLTAVRTALARSVPRWSRLWYDVGADQLMAGTEHGEELPFDLLSDGQRSMIALIADLTYRCLTLNPHAQASAAQEADGIVLIDEIDLHLHPSWQRHVVASLRAAFPRIQFIATTHSPFVVQALRAGELIDLSSPSAQIPGGPSVRPEPAEPYLEGLEDVAEQFMRVADARTSQRRRVMHDLAAQYLRLVQEEGTSSPEATETLRRQLEYLRSEFADNPAYGAFLELRSRQGNGSQ